MKKQKKQNTALNKEKIDTKLLSKQVSRLIDDAVPKDMHGMLALAVESDDGLVLNKRWKLSAVDKNDYFIIDLYSGEKVYQNIALFSNAIQIIWHLGKPIRKSFLMDKLIYELDQEYYRCLEDIRYYNSKVTKNPELRDLFDIRLGQSRYRLLDIKKEISKIY